MFRNSLILIMTISSIHLSCDGIEPVQSLENIAFNKPADQSSMYLFETANKAVDGNISLSAHGNREPNSLNWWKVDLLSMYYISQVILTPRQDFNGKKMVLLFLKSLIIHIN